MGEINTGAIKIQDNWFMKDTVKIQAGAMNLYGTTGYKFNVVPGSRPNSVALEPEKGSLAAVVRRDTDARYSYPSIDLLTGVEIDTKTGTPITEKEGGDTFRGVDDESLAYLRDYACKNNLKGVDVEKVTTLMKNNSREKLPETPYPLPEEIRFNVEYKGEKLNGEIVTFFINSSDKKMYVKGRDGTFEPAGKFRKEDFKF